MTRRDGMKTIHELEREFSAIKSQKLPRKEKASLVKLLRCQLWEIDAVSAANPDYPLSEIHRSQRLMRMMSAYIK